MTGTDALPAGVRLRGYLPGDEESVVALWQAALPMDTIDLALFTARILLDVNFERDGFLVAAAGEEVVGFLYAVVRRTPLYGADFETAEGWATVFFVHPAWRRRGIGTALVRAALAYVHARGRPVLAIAPYAPHYFWPGPDQHHHAAAVTLLKKLGFRVVQEPVSMEIGLAGFTVPEEVRRLGEQRAAEGFRITTLQPCYLPGVLEFAYARFGADWSRAVRDALARGVPMERVLLALRGEEVAGFCLYGGYDHVAERFGPFGVHPDLRGRGLGKLLLYECLSRMRSRGLHTAFFLWTGEDDPAGHLYRQAGFRVSRRFCVFRSAAG